MLTCFFDFVPHFSTAPGIVIVPQLGFCKGPVLRANSYQVNCTVVPCTSWVRTCHLEQVRNEEMFLIANFCKNSISCPLFDIVIHLGCFLEKLQQVSFSHIPVYLRSPVGENSRLKPGEPFAYVNLETVLGSANISSPNSTPADCDTSRRLPPNTHLWQFVGQFCTANWARSPLIGVAGGIHPGVQAINVEVVAAGHCNWVKKYLP